MIPPKKILSTIDRHWQVIEQLVTRFSLTSFTVQDVQSIIKRLNPELSGDAIYKEAQKLIALEILIPLAKSSQLEINRAIQEFCHYLLNEHQLGLAEEINVLINDLTRLSQRLMNAWKTHDVEELRRFSRLMDDRVRQIIKQFTINESAIFNIVEQAKSQSGDMSLEKRYTAVIEAFDEYIDPVLEMVDVNGDFKKIFDTAEQDISEIISQISVTGHMNNEKEMLIQLRTRILDMHLTGQQSLQNSANMLMPVREMLRKNTLLAKQASKVLARCRKRGVDVLAPMVPHFQSDGKRQTLGTKNQMVAFMADLTDFSEKSYELPNNDAIQPWRPPNAPDYQHVLATYKLSKKPGNIFNWLHQQYHDLELDDMLFLYQKLSSESDLTLEHMDKTVIDIGTHQLTLHPLAASDNPVKTKKATS